ncbi:DUF6415 family natural product biosynthesis protein [Streptomyces sp. BRA346]
MTEDIEAPPPSAGQRTLRLRGHIMVAVPEIEQIAAQLPGARPAARSAEIPQKLRATPLSRH